METLDAIMQKLRQKLKLKTFSETWKLKFREIEDERMNTVLKTEPEMIANKN